MSQSFPHCLRVREPMGGLQTYSITATPTHPCTTPPIYFICSMWTCYIEITLKIALKTSLKWYGVLDLPPNIQSPSYQLYSWQLCKITPQKYRPKEAEVSLKWKRFILSERQIWSGHLTHLIAVIVDCHYVFKAKKRSHNHDNNVSQCVGHAPWAGCQKMILFGFKFQISEIKANDQSQGIFGSCFDSVKKKVCFFAVNISFKWPNDSAECINFTIKTLKLW